MEIVDATPARLNLLKPRLNTFVTVLEQAARAQARAIEQISGEHRPTCDIANPSSPQATVAILRFDEDHADFLMLGDSFLAFDWPGDAPHVITDEREVAVRRECSVVFDGVDVGTPEYERARDACIEALRSRRNQPRRLLDRQRRSSRSIGSAHRQRSCSEPRRRRSAEQWGKPHRRPVWAR